MNWPALQTNKTVLVMNNSAVLLTGSLTNVPVEINENFLHLLAGVTCKFKKLRGHHGCDLRRLQEYNYHILREV